MATNDGGPAFPLPFNFNSEGMVHYSEECGMSLRDYFAAKALAGYMANPTVLPPDRDVNDGGKITPQQMADVCAVFAYMVADAMLAAREVPND